MLQIICCDFPFVGQNVHVPNLLQQLPSWWVPRTLQYCCWVSALAEFSLDSALQLLSPATGKRRWEYIFLCPISLFSPEQKILKKLLQVLPSFPHNTFTALLFSPFIEYLPNCPHSVQFQCWQIHFTAPVFTVCFPIPLSLTPFNYHIKFHFFPESHQFKEKIWKFCVSFSSWRRFY